MLNMNILTKEEEEFTFAIEDYDISTIKYFITKGIHKNNIFGEYQEMAVMPLSVFMLSEDNEDFLVGLRIIILFLENDIDINMKSNSMNTALTVAPKNSFPLIKLLLIAGANPNIINQDERSTALSYIIHEIKESNTINILLQYGAYININKRYHSMCNCLLLEKAILHGVTISIISLLNYGADTYYQNEFNDSMIQLLEQNKEKYTQEDYQNLKTLLNPQNPPYLKLGEAKEDKYIIYENKITDESTDIYLLTDKKTHKQKKYLYADNKIDAFVYWCYTNNLLSESVIPVVKLYEEKLDKINYKNINTFITNIIGNEVTTEYFNEEGKEFATSYLTVTHWWYNLHTDFNRLYQEENVKLPRAIQSQEEFDTLIKLLDIRHEQFTSKKDFNSNQNKEELQALIEGKEPPKRVVDLSFLEDDDDSKDNILPKDFLDKS